MTDSFEAKKDIPFICHGGKEFRFAEGTLEGQCGLVLNPGEAAMLALKLPYGRYDKDALGDLAEAFRLFLGVDGIQVFIEGEDLEPFGDPEIVMQH